jgi:hypothetical protein
LTRKRPTGEPKEAERAQGKNPGADPMNLIRVMLAEGETQSLVTIHCSALEEISRCPSALPLLVSDPKPEEAP